jgi:hypothetical protein
MNFIIVILSEEVAVAADESKDPYPGKTCGWPKIAPHPGNCGMPSFLRVRSLP